jgi:transposase
MAQSSNNSDKQGVVSKGGRPPKLTVEQLAQLRTLALEHPRATAEELRRMLREKSGVEISVMTLYRVLPQAGLRRQQPQQTPASFAPPPPSPPARYGYTLRHRDDGDANRYPSSLTEAEWALVADLFERKGPGKPPLYPRRHMLEACCYAVRSGCPWRLLPKDFPAWQDVYATFRRWTQKGLFETMHDRLRSMWRERVGPDQAPTAGVLDSQSVETSAQGGPKGYDAAKKVKGRKRHLVVDVLGLLLAVLILPANIQDRDGAAPVVGQAIRKCPTLKKLYVDTGYAGDCAESLRQTYALDVEVIRRPHKAGVWTDGTHPPPVPPAAPFPILPRRWVVERTNAWVDRPRRLSKDYDRLPDVSAAWVWLAAGRILRQRLAEPEAA